MATLLTPTVEEVLGQVSNLRRYVFTVPTVGATETTGVYSLNVGAQNGVIEYVRISFAGVTTADFHVLVVDNASAIDTYQEIVEYSAVANLLRANSQNIVYSNDEASPVNDAELYLVIENLLATPTGEIKLEIGVR